MIKTMILTASVLVLSSVLVCSNVEVSVKEKDQSTLSVESGQLKRKVIIRNSIYDPLPAGAQKALSLPDKAGPQQLPNVDLSTPIIITKMPYHERKKSQ
ncbi:hypothetical protein Desde_0838 [Desulfitobacterium dehalogenans ATCC 51507]|uniref:Uncharacterized protein n=1 Tax=Desulfitobacterium dehalogenans (strain ATCC 51507 / DSM 9161 / JW/IU-DC1) TaxID=756499 RepID=I4A5P8_DESDJ|nr:hypothetical protein [Desulfitobacterium dehalogenans]AFL99282.1 hypothetical protein Desde_0838 [Desulfitobacterium dehalogenans ATCC 51507]